MSARSKEFPVSEANAGGTPPKGLGTNIERSAHTQDGNDGPQKSKRKRRTRRPRRNRSKADNRPDVSVDQGAIDVSSRPDGANASLSPSQDSDIAPRGSGKRARRRQRRGRQNDRARTDTSTSPATDNANAPSEQGALPRDTNGTPNKNNQRRRNKRRDGKGRREKPDEHKAATPLTDQKTSRHTLEAYAALDLGTNNCRLLIAIPQQPGRFRVIDAYSRIVRLGEGLASSGNLNDLAMERAVEALKACAEKLSNRSVKNVRLIATEACRQAENGGDFLKRVEAEAGLKLEVVDRETEARLAVAGCSSLVDRKAKGVVLFDIGGGSSELALLDLRKRKRHDLGPAMVSWTSLPVGVVTLSERHGGGEHVTREIFDAMVADVMEMLQTFEGRDALKSAAAAGEVHLLGTSGTVTTLAGIHLKLPRYDRRQVDGTWMVLDDVDKIIDNLVDMTFEERVSNPCIGKERADLVLAGCAILVAIRQIWPCPRLRVADRGLREGLLTEMMNADNAWIRKPFRHKRGKR